MVTNEFADLVRSRIGQSAPPLAAAEAAPEAAPAAQPTALPTAAETVGAETARGFAQVKPAFEDTSFLYFPVPPEVQRSMNRPGVPLIRVNADGTPIVLSQADSIRPAELNSVGHHLKGILSATRRSASEVMKGSSAWQKVGALALAGLLINQVHPGLVTELRQAIGTEAATAASDTLITKKDARSEINSISGNVISSSTPIGKFSVLSTADVVVPIKLAGNKMGSVALPTTKNRPKVTVNTDVQMYIANISDSNKKPTSLASVVGDEITIDRSHVYLLPAFVGQKCVAEETAPKMCVDAFTGNTQLKANDQVSATEAARINALLQPAGKSFAAYQSASTQKLEQFALIRAQKNCAKQIIAIGDSAVLAYVKAEAAKRNMKLTAENVHFKNEYGSLSKSFGVTHKAALTNNSLSLNAPVTSCTVEPQGVTS